jgi:prepilin-type N-terminal cleavage/methylation domain-containing protein
MVFNNTFTKSGHKRSGFTLIEVLITSAITLLVGAAIAILYLYSSRTFLTLDNYTDMCQRSQLALDKMSKDIRQAKQVTAFTTNSISFQDINGNPLQFTYDSTAKTLVRLSGGKSTTYLNNCDSLEFWIYQPIPMSNSFACYSPAFLANARVVQITWMCSRKIMGKKTTTESMESAQIAMRNH